MAVRKSVLYSFFVVIAALLIGFRSLEFGTDTQAYYNQYLNQKACYCIPNHFEPGIELLGFASSLMQLCWGSSPNVLCIGCGVGSHGISR